MKKEITVSQEQREEFGQRIRQVRENLRLQQKEFAAGLGKSESYICQIEKGNANPTFEFFHELASKYNVSMDYLFYGKGDMIYKRKMPMDGETEIRDAIDTMDDLYWYLEHSELFRHCIMGDAIRFLYNNSGACTGLFGRKLILK